MLEICFHVGGTPNWPPDPPISPPPGGGGGNNPTPPNNCTGVNECRPGSQIVEGKVPCGGCGGGPIVVVPLSEPISQQEIDNLWMDESIEDSTNNPCIANTLATLKTIASKLPALMRSVFDTSLISEFDMKLKLENLGNSLGGAMILNVNNNKFNVKINSFFDNATDLSVVSTIIHEAFHCQLINWYRITYLLGDTIKMNNLALNYGYIFSKESIDWNSNLAAIVYGANGANMHQDIAISYRNMVGETIYQFALAKGITNLTLQQCKKLAWSGC